MGSEYTVEKNEVQWTSHQLTDDDVQPYEFYDEGHPGAIRLERLEDLLPGAGVNCDSLSDEN